MGGRKSQTVHAMGKAGSFAKRVKGLMRVEEFRSSGVRMQAGRGCEARVSRWVGALLAGVLMAGVAGAQAPTATAAAGAAGVQAGKTRLHGVVTDPDGALIPGATGTLTGNGAGVKATAGS